MIEKLETTLQTFNLDVESKLSYHQRMSNQINEGIITDPELLEQIAKLRYYEPADTGINPSFAQEWNHFITLQISEPPHEAAIENTRLINKMKRDLHNRVDELFPAYEGMHIGLCTGTDQLFSAETKKSILLQMEQAGGRIPYIIAHVPSRTKQYTPSWC